MDHLKSPLIADRFQKDPRVAQAKALILNTLQEHQLAIKGVEGPKAELKTSYQELLDRLSAERGGSLFFPYLGSGIGKGCMVELADGSIKYDMICGIGPHYFGHSHLELVEAEIDAALSDLVMQGHLQQNVESAKLCHLLTQASGKEHCFLTSTGVMANENGLKILFQKKAPAHRLLAFEHCFAGRTLAMSQVTDKPAYRQGLPSNLFVDYVPFYDHQNPEASTSLALATLKQHLERHPKQYAAMIFEMVQGEGGIYPGDKRFFVSLMELLKQHGVGILVDEVQTFGRTPTLFAFQHFGLQRYVDVISVGKLSQVCATLFGAELKPAPGLLSQTFISSTSAIAAALVIMRNLMKGDFFGAQGKIERIHAHFVRRFEEVQKRHPGLIHGPFGIGAMVAFTPLKGDAETTRKFLYALYEAGVIGFVAGSHPTRIRFLIPIGTITEADVDAVVQIVERVLLTISQEDHP